MKINTKIIKKLTACILAAAAALSLWGCSEVQVSAPMDSATLVTIESASVKTTESIFRLLELKNAYGKTDPEFFESEVDGMTMGEYIKDSIKEEMIMLCAVQNMAEEMAVYLSEEELAAASEKAQEAYKEISALYDPAAYAITIADAESLYEKQALYEKIYGNLTDSVTMEISESDTKVIEVNYCLLPEEATLTEAENLRSAISAGEFQTACESAGYTPVMNVQLRKGDMIEAFENVAFSLGDGEVSECTETIEGIYVIQCVDDYLSAESSANYNAVISQEKEKLFEEAYHAYSDGKVLRFNSEVWEEISVAGL